MSGGDYVMGDGDEGFLIQLAFTDLNRGSLWEKRIPAWGNVRAKLSVVD